MSADESIAAQAVDAQVLHDHLVQAGIEVAGPLTIDLIGGGKSNITCRVTDGTSRWILRRPPLGDYAAGAHDVGREFRVMTALAGSQVPVPDMVLDCTDPSVIGAPFYLMSEVAGRVIRAPQDVADLTEATRHELGTHLVNVLADLHSVDAEAVGLGGLGRPLGYLERQVSRWIRQMEAVQQRPLEHVAELSSILRGGMPASAETTIVHGDYRLDNVVVSVDQPTGVLAVLDWEMATLGDPLADLATLLMFWDVPGRPFNPITQGLMAEPGFPTAEEAVAIYRERRQVEVEHFDWYMVFSQFKLAVILEQIRVRHAAGETLGGGFDDLGKSVDFLLDAAMEHALASPTLSAYLPAAR